MVTLGALIADAAVHAGKQQLHLAIRTPAEAAIHRIALFLLSHVKKVLYFS